MLSKCDAYNKNDQSCMCVHYSYIYTLAKVSWEWDTLRDRGQADVGGSVQWGVV